MNIDELIEDERYDLLHTVTAIEEVGPAAYHVTLLDGERAEIVAETMTETLLIAETPGGSVVPEDEMRPCLNRIWLERLRSYIGDPVVFNLLASIEERIEAIGWEKREVARWVARHTEAA